MDAGEAAKNALECVLEARKGETFVIFYDAEKTSVCEAFATGASKLGLKTQSIRLETSPNTFRKELPEAIVQSFKNYEPDIYVNLLRGIREETPFRIQLTRMETRSANARLAHCPGITLDMLTDGALAMKKEDHRSMQGFARKLIQSLSRAARVEVANPAGTKISLNVEGRPFFTDTIISWETKKWMNMPTGEVIVAPVESSLEGRLVCDMAIGGIRPLKSPVEIVAEKGIVQTISSDDTSVIKGVEDSLGTDGGAKVMGEFAFGINPKARFCDEFLESEKMLGTVHLAFGNNSDMPGGMNHSNNHTDFLMSKPTVEIVNNDDTRLNVLTNGVFRRL